MRIIEIEQCQLPHPTIEGKMEPGFRAVVWEIDDVDGSRTCIDICESFFEDVARDMAEVSVIYGVKPQMVAYDYNNIR